MLLSWADLVAQTELTHTLRQPEATGQSFRWGPTISLFAARFVRLCPRQLDRSPVRRH
jgi:hypothetical protein